MAWLKLAALIALPIALACVPTGVVERGPTLCLFKLLFGWECWGCGTTRALSCAFHGQFGRAWQFNHLVVVVGPLLVGIWVGSVRNQWRHLRGGRPLRLPPDLPASGG